MKGWVFILLLETTSALLQSGRSTDIKDEFKEYIKKIRKCNALRPQTCNYVNGNSGDTEDFAGWFISKNNCQLVLSREYKTDSIFIFMSSIEEIYGHIENILKNYNYANTVNVHFILVNQLKDRSVLPQTLQYIWSRYISRFVLVFVDEKYEVYSYNPFKHKHNMIKIVNFGRTCDNLFPDRAKNFFGNELRVALFEKKPFIYHENAQWRGGEVELMKSVERILNAKIRVIQIGNDYNTDITTALMSNMVDIVMVRLSRVAYHPNTSISHPFESDDKVIVVPKPRDIPYYQNFLSISHPIVIIMCFIVMGSMMTVFHLDHLSGPSIDPISSYFTLLQTAVGQPTPNFPNIRGILKCLLMLWIFCSIVFCTTFNTFLTSMLIRSHKKKGITTLTDLRKSGMPIYISYYWNHSKIFSEELGLRKQFVEVKSAAALLEEKNITGAIFERRTVAESFITLHKTKDGDGVYKIIPESFIPSFSVYSLQKHSPYLSQFNRCISLVQEFGFRKKWWLKKKRRSNETETLKLRHLKILIVFLFCGLSFASTVFLIEILWVKIIGE